MSRLNLEYMGVMLRIEYDYDPGQRAIIDIAPENCQEGFPTEVQISKIEHFYTDIIDLMDEVIIEDIAKKIQGYHDGLS